ncbi:proline-rich protein 36-like [Heterocephalus glaber]|uniref:Proline-rich protein 36-like n=1 Tax=Heterocephalus glaber TaxID=10181 RepID=A0AAX6PGI9_HETGA|nr:proline-rich protein 36-like [Heterocephalus glaber]
MPSIPIQSSARPRPQPIPKAEGRVCDGHRPWRWPTAASPLRPIPFPTAGRGVRPRHGGAGSQGQHRVPGPQATFRARPCPLLRVLRQAPAGLGARFPKKSASRRPRQGTQLRTRCVPGEGAAGAKPDGDCRASHPLPTAPGWGAATTRDPSPRPIAPCTLRAGPGAPIPRRARALPCEPEREEDWPEKAAAAGAASGAPGGSAAAEGSGSHNGRTRGAEPPTPSVLAAEVAEPAQPPNPLPRPQRRRRPPPPEALAALHPTPRLSAPRGSAAPCRSALTSRPPADPERLLSVAPPATPPRRHPGSPRPIHTPTLPALGSGDLSALAWRPLANPGRPPASPPPPGALCSQAQSRSPGCRLPLCLSPFWNNLRLASFCPLPLTHILSPLLGPLEENALQELNAGRTRGRLHLPRREKGKRGARPQAGNSDYRLDPASPRRSLGGSFIH